METTNDATRAAAEGLPKITASHTVDANVKQGEDYTSQNEMPHAELAALDFEPWVHQLDEWTPPSNKEWAGLANPYLVAVRLAWITLYKIKPELIEILKVMEEDEVFESYAGSIQDSIDFFRVFLTVLETANVRILCAAANVVEGGAA